MIRERNSSDKYDETVIITKKLIKPVMVKMKKKLSFWQWDWEEHQWYFYGTISKYLQVHRRSFVMFTD
jgi:hypothetical protein